MVLGVLNRTRLDEAAGPDSPVASGGLDRARGHGKEALVDFLRDRAGMQPD